jgi:hypothetical protein
VVGSLQTEAAFFMSKKQWRFKPSEIQRLVKAAQSIGLKVSGIEVGADNIRVVVVNEPKTPDGGGAAA